MTSEAFEDPQFDVFHNEAIDASASGCWIDRAVPIESLSNGGDLRFELNGDEQYWMAWGDAFITMEVQLQAIDNTSGAVRDMTAADKAIIINNSAHSLFDDVRLKINQKCVEGGTGMYAFLSYMNNLINFNQAAKGTHMISQGYHIPSEHPSGKSFETDEDNTTNAALIKLYEKSAWVYKSFPLKLNLFQQGKSCPPGFRLDLNLVRNRPEFCIKRFAGADKYKFNLRNVTLHMPMIHPNARLQTQIATKRKNKSILYQFNNLTCFRHTVSSGSQEHTFFNIFQVRQPKLAIIALFPSNHYGNFNQRKFIFKKHGLKEVILRTEGRMIGGEPINCSNDLAAYSKLNQALSIYNSNEDVGVDFDCFKNYTWLAGFDCTPNSNVEAIQKPSLRKYDLELKFDKTTTENYDVLVYFVEDTRVILQSNNNVVPNDFIPL